MGWGGVGGRPGAKRPLGWGGVKKSLKIMRFRVGVGQFSDIYENQQPQVQYIVMPTYTYWCSPQPADGYSTAEVRSTGAVHVLQHCWAKPDPFLPVPGRLSLSNDTSCAPPPPSNLQKTYRYLE